MYRFDRNKETGRQKQRRTERHTFNVLRMKREKKSETEIEGKRELETEKEQAKRDR